MRARPLHRRHRTPVWSVSLLAALCWAPPAAAQYGIDAWTADRDLPQNVVYQVHHARDGYLWIASYDGLARFDGVRFTVFDRTNTPGIEGNRFTSIHESASGELWFGAAGGVTRLRDGTFTTYTTEHGLPHPLVTGITGDPAGTVWALSNEVIVRWSGDAFRPHEETAGMRFTASRWTPGVFLGLDGKAFHRFAGGQLTSWPAPELIRTMPNPQLEYDQAGSIWVRASDRRFAVVQDGELRRVYSADATGRAADPPPEPDGVIVRYTDQRNHVWELQVDPQLTRRMTLESGGERRQIRFDGLHEDREGNLWLAVHREGLYRVREQHVRVLSRQHGLGASNIYALLEDRRGSIWIAAWDTGVSRYREGRFTIYTPGEGLATRWITALAEDAEGRIWSAGYHEINGGIRVFDGTRWAPLPDRILPDHTVVPAIHHEPDGTVWLGTSRGLVRYRHGATTWYTTADGLASDDVKVVIGDGSGGLWIGGHGGVSHLSNGQVRHWTDRDGLPGGSIRALYLDDRGVLWIGSYDDGLGRLEDGRAVRLTMREGLFNNGAFQILEDDAAYFWIGCNRGIYRVSRDELDAVAAGRLARVTALAIGRGDGLLNAEANGGTWPAGLRAADGTLWFPTQDGVAIVDPASWRARVSDVPVRIETALVDREPAPIDRPITLRPPSRYFEIQYTGLSFVGSEHIRFRYQLEGLDDEWIDAGTRRTAYYSHVPPGEYRFRVIAAGADGVWSTTPATIAVHVVPPFWRTAWFGVLACAGIGGVAIAGYRRRVVALERAQKAQEAFSRELIASQERERRRIAGELHDGLGQSLIVLRNWAAIGIGSVQPSAPGREELDEIARAAGRAIEEMRSIVRDLGPCDVERIGLADALVEMVERLEGASGIRFRLDLDEVEGCLTREHATALYRVAQEALNNIVKHSGASQAEVVLKRLAGRVTLTICDDGRGFDAAVPAGGFGLRGMAERMRLAGGELTLDAVPGRGTTVRAVVTGGNDHGA